MTHKVANGLRADAERNRRRILAAATTLFATKGLEVSLDQVAAEAQVGVGTVYRRFENRDALVQAIFVDTLEDIDNELRTHGETSDPWDGFVDAFTALAERAACDRGLALILTAADHKSAEVLKVKDRIEAAVEKIVQRARESGAIRPDLHTYDLWGMLLMITAVAQSTDAIVAGTWRRYLQLLVDGVSGDGRRGILPGAPLGPEQLVEASANRGVVRPN